MNDKLEFPQPTSPKSKASKFVEDFPGQISNIIGSGKHAQTAIVYKTIGWSFFAGSVFTIILFLLAWLTDECPPIEDIKTIWSIFIPVITLALGYVFGKGRE